MVAALALKKDNSSIPLKRLCNFADRAEPRQFHIARRAKMKGTPQDKKRKQAKGALGSGPANLHRMNRKSAAKGFCTSSPNLQVHGLT